MGRFEKDPAIHKLQGTKSVAQSAAFVIPAGRPKFPKGISPVAKSKFKRLCGLLEERRALTAGDGELLNIYARLHTRWEKALAAIEAQGEICSYTRLDSNGAAHEMYKKNLWLPIAETCEKNMVACLDRLGLTPIAHAKVKPVGVDKPKELTPEEEYFDRIARGSTGTNAPATTLADIEIPEEIQ
jgi:P27 family predicted phage terminase small subunit